MKIILGISIIISANLSAQEKVVDTIKKSNTIKSEQLMRELIAKNPSIIKPDSSQKQKNVYKMQIAKPKDTSVYLSLKESDKDYSKHKILNSLAPEDFKKEIKK